MAKNELSSEEGQGESSGEEQESIDQEKLNELANALEIEDPEEKKQFIAQVNKFTSSPVPPAKVLKGYDNIVDDGAKWLLDYTKDEQIHRHRMDDHVVFGQK